MGIAGFFNWAGSQTSISVNSSMAERASLSRKCRMNASHDIPKKLAKSGRFQGRALPLNMAKWPEPVVNGQQAAGASRTRSLRAAPVEQRGVWRIRLVYRR